MPESSELRRGRTAPPFAMVPVWVTAANITPQAKALYAVLAAHLNSVRGDGLVWPGMASVAGMLGYSRRQTIRPYLHELEELGAIDVETEHWTGGRRHLYTVHEAPPKDYAGPLTLADYYATVTQDERDEQRDSHAVVAGAIPAGIPAGIPTGSPDRSRTSQIPTGVGRPSAQPMGRPSDHEAHEDELEEDAFGGALPGSRSSVTARHQPRILKAKDLQHLDTRALTQKLTAIWSAIVTEHGGLLPGNDTPGWDRINEGYETKHPVGGQIRQWVNSAEYQHPEVLDPFIDDVRRHAIRYAELNPCAWSA